MLLASPGLKELAVDVTSPDMGELLSLLMRFLNSWAIWAAVWSAIPSGGTLVSVVSNVYLTPLIVTL